MRWCVRRFDRPVDTPGQFDLAICIGNSLALAADLDQASAGVAQMLRAVRPGGAVVVQVVNLWRFPDGPCFWQKSVRATLPRGPGLIIKGTHRAGSRGFVELLVADLDADPPQLKSRATAFIGLETAHLGLIARQAGAAAVQFFGGYRSQPYDPTSSEDLIMLASK
jgi:SAM-dependent methyltransferase